MPTPPPLVRPSLLLPTTQVDESALSVEEQKERKIMKLLLKVKNGTPPQRKSALRQLTDKARDFGAGPLFNQILPLLMQPTLEDQERHLLVKVIDRCGGQAAVGRVCAGSRCICETGMSRSPCWSLSGGNGYGIRSSCTLQLCTRTPSLPFMHALDTLHPTH